MSGSNTIANQVRVLELVSSDIVLWEAGVLCGLSWPFQCALLARGSPD